MVAELGGLEATSRLLTYRGRRGLPGHFALPWTSIPAGLGLALVFAVGAWDVTWGWSAAPMNLGIASGITLFVLGWLLRYPAMLNPEINGNRLWDRVHRELSRLRSEGPLRVRHQRYTGLWLEAVGLSLCVGSLITIGLAAFAMPVIIIAAATLEEHSAITKWRARTQQDWPYEDMRKPIFFRWQLLPWIISLPLVIGIIVGIATREIELLYADAETAQTVLLGLGGGQLVFLTFILSSVLVGVQFLASSYSWRAAEVILRRPLLFAACAFVLLSAFVNLSLVVRSEDFIEGAPGIAIHSTAFDLAAFATLLSSVTLVLALLRLGPMFTAEALMFAVLSRLRLAWVTSIQKDWRRLRVIPASDPFLPAVDILHKLLQRGDATGFRLCMAQLRDLLQQVWPVGDSPLSIAGHGMPGQPREDSAGTWPAGERIEQARSVDNYLWWRLRSLIRAAAEYHDPEFLEIVFDMFKELYQQCHPYVIGDETPFWLPSDVPMGERLLREVTAAATRGSKGEIAGWSSGAAAFACQRLVKALPPLSETSFLDRLDEEPPRLTKEEQEARRKADNKLDVVRSGYTTYFKRSGRLAADMKNVEAVSGALLSLNKVVKAAANADVPWDTSRLVINQALSELMDLLHHVLQEKLRVPIWSPADDIAVQMHEPLEDDAKKLLATLVRHQTELLGLVRSARRLDMLSVGHAEVVLWKALRAGVEGTAGLLQEVGLIAVSTEDLSDGRYPEYPKKEARKLVKSVHDWAGRTGHSVLEKLCASFIDA